MNELLDQLNQFFQKNEPAIIVNTSTNKALLCLSPEFEIHPGMVMMKFQSFNERGGNSVFIKSIQGYEENTLYVDNEEDNILMLQSISLANYKHYIQPNYNNSPDFPDLKSLKTYIRSQKPNDY